MVFKCGFYDYSGLVLPNRADDCHGRVSNSQTPGRGDTPCPAGPRGKHQGRSGAEGQRGRWDPQPALWFSWERTGLGWASWNHGLQGVWVAPHCLVPGPGVIGTGQCWPQVRRGHLGCRLWVGLYVKDGLPGEWSVLSGSPPALGGAVPPGPRGPGRRSMGKIKHKSTMTTHAFPPPHAR